MASSRKKKSMKDVQIKVYMKARDRGNPSVNYLKPITNREEWFRYNMDVTPGPNYYFDDSAPKNDFVSKMLARKSSYLFKSEGRTRPVVTLQDGQWLMPGEYNLGGIVQDLEKSKATYGFKNTGRDAAVFTAVQPDKGMTVGPNEYSLEKFGSFYVPIKPVGQGNFKSKTDRFQMRQEAGPDPTSYSPRHPKPNAIKSCFKSKTPKMSYEANNKFPGPGAYSRSFEPLFLWHSCHKYDV